MTKSFLKAAAAGQLSKLEFLLADGADIDFADKMPGRTELIEAAIADQVPTVKFLIGRGANPNLTDSALGYTALGWAALNGNREIVDLLLAAGAQVDLTASKFQYSPLMVAAQAGQREVVQALLAAGANATLQTGDGRNALAMAQSNHHDDICALLKLHGAPCPSLEPEVTQPWPALAADLHDVDDSDPAQVLRGFILAMHGWETGCEGHRQSVGDAELDWEFIRRQQDQVFECYCTPKPRPYGRQGSFGWPSEYTPEEALVSISVDGNRATVTTRQAPGRVLRYEMQYTLLLKKKLWRVDSKQSRIWGSQDWERIVL